MASIKRLNHIQITIPKGAEVIGRNFYCVILGLCEIDKPASLQGRGGFWLEVGEQQIHIGTEDGVDRYATKAHMALEVDDIGAWRDRLQAVGGVDVLESVPIPGYARFELRDPFGNRLEIIQPV